jgi:CheY-like chemotaxis protein
MVTVNWLFDERMRANPYVVLRTPKLTQLQVRWHNFDHKRSVIPRSNARNFNQPELSTAVWGCSMDASGQHARIEASDLTRPVLRVLVVDDDESVGVAIQAILSRRNYRTELASGAYAGIQALASSRFDVVLVDLFLTGMSGIDAIAHMRQLSEISIIAMSGFRLRSSLDPIDHFGTAMQRGASTCIRKPFSPRQLIEAIDSSVAGSPLAGVALQ